VQLALGARQRDQSVQCRGFIAAVRRFSARGGVQRGDGTGGVAFLGLLAEALVGGDVAGAQGGQRRNHFRLEDGTDIFRQADQGILDDGQRVRCAGTITTVTTITEVTVVMVVTVPLYCLEGVFKT
jgi:hypothetical protein